MMKKSKLIVLSSVLLTLVTGCGDGSSTISSESESITVSDSSISESESSGSLSTEESTSTTTSEPASSETSSETSNSEEISSSEYSIPSTSEDPSSEDPVEPGSIGEIQGLEPAIVIVGHYFNPLKGVKIYSTTGIDITRFVDIIGSVDYGTLGNYTLNYRIEYAGETQNITRNVVVQNGTYVPPTSSKIINSQTKIAVDSGSYRSGNASDIAHPKQPAYLEADLLDKPVPTNGWWTTLISENYGAGNGIFLNPLRSSIGNYGVEITNRGEGFVQYWDIGDYPTMAQFTPHYQDLKIKAGTLATTSISKVIDYSDNNVKVAMRNLNSSEDEMIITYTQGSPYVFTEYKNKNDIRLLVDNRGVDNYQYFTLDGTPITSSYTGNAIIVKMVKRHIGYITSLPNIVGGATYEDRYFVVNAPDSTTFTLSNSVHPAGYLDTITMDLGSGNYVSVAAINNLTEASFYHQNGYAFMAASNIDYTVDREQSSVTTFFENNVQYMRTSDVNTGVLALLPHQYKVSDATLTSYQTRTIRGTLKMMLGDRFTTELNFRGILPSYTLPTNAAFNEADVVSYLAHLDQGTEILDYYEEGGKNFIDAPGPYWNAKALYPLSQGLIIAAQIGETTHKASFINKLKTRLIDWFTYDETNSEDRYLYYNQTWNSLYYSNNDFGTASELTDHHFTHGYLVYAASVLSMFDQDFFNQYHAIVALLLKDYMNYNSTDKFAPFLRSFDGWAGHSWAHGYGSFADGNNQESSGEALNSWAAGYFFGLALGNNSLIDAAIYGYTTELYSIKQYWFNYDNDNWKAEYAANASVAGMIWGAKTDYATWFGANPTFIYGIHWLPTGEYLSSYALGTADRNKLTSIYQKYLQAVGGAPNTWYSNMWAIQALIDPSAALSNFNANMIKNDDYPNELVGAYWMVNALQTLQMHSASAWMEIEQKVAASIYDNGSDEIALLWNASNYTEEVTLHRADGTTVQVTVAARSFTSVVI